MLQGSVKLKPLLQGMLKKKTLREESDVHAFTYL